MCICHGYEVHHLPNLRHRCLGDARFTIGALHQILWRHCHRLRLAFLPTSLDSVQTAQQVLQRHWSNVSGWAQAAGVLCKVMPLTCVSFNILACTYSADQSSHSQCDVP